MKAVILAGGKGTRISEESYLKPKPLIEIGGKPIIWHIMKIFSSHGINEFIICCGYKGYMIKEYFANYFLHTSDVTFHLDQDNYMEVHRRKHEKWKVTLIDTGENTQTGGRLLRVRDFINDDIFCLTDSSTISLTTSTPLLCPLLIFREFDIAHLPLPSIIIAICLAMFFCLSFDELAMRLILNF